MTGGADDPGRSPAAERQARARERAATARRLTAELLEAGRIEARQAGLALTPAVEPEPMAPGPLGGRPGGSVAKKTADWQRFILSRYRSPLVFFAEVAARPVRDLADELGCTVLEAFELQMRAAGELAPFVHSKMPTALQLDAAPEAPIVLAVTPAMAARIGVQQAPAEADPTAPGAASAAEGAPQGNQGLGEGEQP